ncbi:MAG: bifunctional diaminohydroxyphosphoribosylaminopyrimidine deaminase/5-amino-6-(5-phosphoribosylamino)uracil reductase RibD [Gemmatimonadales bacterium]
MSDREAMHRAIELAWRGWGRVGANPMVGAVVVRDGAVLGEGWHAEFGGPHAEALALAAAGARARGADLVVSLEPCAHHGKTPPCVEAISAAGIKRVVFGAADVDVRAKGGARVLERAGVAVEGGLMADDVRAQNAAFFHRHGSSDRPFVAVKLAVSLDGRIADSARRSKWITGDEARKWVHWLRAGFDAIGVAVGTVKADDPRLTVRGDVVPGVPPLRVVFDTRAETPQHAELVATAPSVPTLALVAPGADASRVEALRGLGVEIGEVAGLAAALRAHNARGVSSLLIEGGGVLTGRLMADGFVDRLFLMTGPVILGKNGVPAFGELAGTPLERASRWRTVGRKALGPDTLTVFDR